MERFEFSVNGEILFGNLHSPKSAGPFPTVITCGPMTSVKEQVTGAYAKDMRPYTFRGLGKI
jgi:hypothetical protein